MAIKLNDILHLSREELNNSKIELSMRDGSTSEKFIDRWLGLPDDVKKSGENTGCAFWGWSGDKRNVKPGQLSFAFIRMDTADDEWLFVSAAEILEVPEHSYAVVRILEKYKDMFGRLIVKYKKTDTYPNYVFYMSNRIEDCVVKEILPCLYSGERFEGYDNVYLPFEKLEKIFKGEIMPSYSDALKKVTGVYCLTDTNTGKLYIGSATGAEGVWQRWGDYFSTKHGNNKKLKSLYAQEGEEYFKQYFTFTLLEYFGLSYDPEKVKEREQYWKKCFQTISKGYNDN